jgi:NTE family protein
MPLLTDGSLYRYKSYLNKERSGSYILSLPLDSLSKVKRVSRAGIIEGKNILSLFDRHLQAYPDSMPSFSALPTNFACVAADIVNGREVVLDHGNLSRSIRPACPFPACSNRADRHACPRRRRLLNNFPWMWRRMGADIVIGINLGDGLKAHSDITSTSGMLDQLISMSAQAKLDRNIPDTDIYVRVNTQGYSAGSFSTAAIDTLLRRGEESTRQQQQEALDSLGRWLGGNKEFLARQQHSPDSLVYK